MTQATEPAKSKTNPTPIKADPKTNGHQATSQPKKNSNSVTKSNDNMIPSQFGGTWYDGNQNMSLSLVKNLFY